MHQIDYNKAYDILGIMHHSLSGDKQYMTSSSMTSPNGLLSEVILT
jgi:hypothetical protein